MRLLLAGVLLLALLAAGCAVPPSRRDAPFVLEPGADVGSAYLPALAVRDDGGFDASVVGVAGATLRISDAFHLTNRGDAALLVTVLPHDPAAGAFWRVGLGDASGPEALLPPGATLRGAIVLAFPEERSGASVAGFDLGARVQG